jgi:hypothetical protein
VVPGACWPLPLVESVRQEWYSGRKSPWSVETVATPGIALLAEGTIEDYHVLVAQVSRVKTQSSMDVRQQRHRCRALLGGAASGDPSRLLAVVVDDWWGCLVCCGCGGRLVRVGRDVQRAHGGVASGWRA